MFFHKRLSEAVAEPYTTTQSDMSNAARQQRQTQKMTPERGEDLWAELLSSSHSLASVVPDYKHRRQVDGCFTTSTYTNTHTDTQRNAAGDSPMGMTTPKTATVRFSPRRKCSLPAEERERERESQIRRWYEGG